MRKKLQGQTRRFRSVKLYKNDIEEIMTILSTAFEDNFHKFEISDDECNYDSIADLEKQKGQKINDFRLSCASPLFSLRISLQETQLVRGGEIESIAPYHQIETLLKKRQRLALKGFFNPVFYFLVCTLIVLSIYQMRYILLGPITSLMLMFSLIF